MERSPRVCPGCRLDGRCLRQSDADEAQECYQAFLQLNLSLTARMYLLPIDRLALHALGPTAS